MTPPTGGVPPGGVEHPATLAEALLAAGNLDDPDGGLRFVDRRERVSAYSWEQVLTRAGNVAAGLRRIGIERGDRVALVFPTSIEFFDAFFGAALAGAVPVPLYPPVRLGRLQEYHAQTAALVAAVDGRLILTDGRARKLLGQVVERAAPELGLRLVSDVRSAGEGATGPVSPSTTSGDLAFIQYSSGTTVMPKPVGLSNRAVVAQAAAVIEMMEHRRGEFDRGVVSWLPLYHDMGLIGTVFPALLEAGSLTLIGPELFLARPSIWLRTLSVTGALASAAPNFAYALCAERIKDAELEGVDLSGWYVALNGAEPVSPSVMRRFADRFGRYGFAERAMTPVYGLSEASLAVTFSSIEDPPHVARFDADELARTGRAVPAVDGSERVSVGRPIPGFRIEVRNELGTVVPPGQVGRVFVRGPSVMDGYVGRPEATEEVLSDGWLDTGDLGFLHEGELFLTGRSKDVLIVRGQNHAPQDVEHALDPLSGVRTGCTVAVTHAGELDATERLLVFVERARNSTTDDTSLEEACREAVVAATGLRIDRLEVLEPGVLPRTSSGKLRRSETLRRYLDGELTAPEPASAAHIARAAWRSRRALKRHERGSG